MSPACSANLPLILLDFFKDTVDFVLFNKKMLSMFLCLTPNFLCIGSAGAPGQVCGVRPRLVALLRSPGTAFTLRKALIEWF